MCWEYKGIDTFFCPLDNTSTLRALQYHDVLPMDSTVDGVGGPKQIAMLHINYVGTDSITLKTN